MNHSNVVQICINSDMKVDEIPSLPFWGHYGTLIAELMQSCLESIFQRGFLQVIKAFSKKFLQKIQKSVLKWLQGHVNLVLHP